MQNESQSDPHAATQRMTPDSERPDTEPPGAAFPDKFGRYSVRDDLGRGGFARVLLAHDTELDRSVAIKVPRRDRFSARDSLQKFLDEAKAAARLRHPGIVTVYDVGLQDSIPYIVMEYVRGRTLSQFLRQEQISHVEAAHLARQIADALAHAHEEGFVHRDLKPQNILLDNEDRPHISDFGLALRHRDVRDTSTKLIGTPRYMAPEQALGENHRVDERSDIWALGVIFYKLLCRRDPFDAVDPRELFRRIIAAEFVRPIQVHSDIPVELDRICCRCLSRRMTERYRHANELVAELDSWLRFIQGDSGSGQSSAWRYAAVANRTEVAVIPRGLRSFEPQDADFFARLIPGPVDRFGVPILIRFWKDGIEQRDPEQAFRVGLLYGPSGCGKSSIVRAGVLPRLDSTVTTIYVDATGRDLERRLQRSVRREFKRVPPDGDLSLTMYHLREHCQTQSDRKVVFVIDQFEQWLSEGHANPNSELVQALRQCDGGHLQCLLLVRDDFWLPISRFMQLLEINIVDGENAMLIDSFDGTHARNVLRELGAAYGCLPSTETEMTAAQHAFLEQAIVELSNDGRLYPVRLAAFIEMVRQHPWEASTLRELGGADGIGVAFLDHTIGREASPSRRAHVGAARNVLAALVPPRGQIKNVNVRREELRSISGYAEAPREFDQLMHLLDTELRLLTPVLSEDFDSQSATSVSQAKPPSDTYYQLTHDFLVSSIRDWLERDLRSTRRGRVLLQLQDQAELWETRHSRRLLPSFGEWIQYQFRTRRDDWNEVQRNMMRAAGRQMGKRAVICAAALAVALLILIVVNQRLQRSREQHDAQLMFNSLQVVDMDDVPSLLDDMQPYHSLILPQARGLLEDESQSLERRLRAGLFVLRTDATPVPHLVRWLASEETPSRDFLTVRAELQAHADVAVREVETILNRRLENANVRLRAACLLAGLNSESDDWNLRAHDVAASLLTQPPRDADVWTQALKPVGTELLPHLTKLTRSATELQSARIGVSAIEAYTDADESAVLELLKTANAVQFRAVVEQVRQRRESTLAWVRHELAELDKFTKSSDETRATQANLALIALILGDPEPLQTMTRRSADPVLRAHLIAAITPNRIEPWRLESLVLTHQHERDLLNPLLLAAAEYADQTLVDRAAWIAVLQELYLTAGDSETHSAAGLLLRRWRGKTRSLDQQLANGGIREDRDWFVDLVGQTMHIVHFRAPEDGASYRFAVSATEVPLSLFRDYRSNFKVTDGMRAGGDETPVTDVIQLEVAGFCNWLSSQNGIADDQWCYPPEHDLSIQECLPHSDFVERNGYRMMTAEEWQFLERAGREQAWFHALDDADAQDYVWSRESARMKLQPVAMRLPDPLGLFDVHGNASEFVIIREAVVRRRVEDAFEARGSNVLRSIEQRSPAELGTDTPRLDTSTRRSYVGFRVVRTIAD